MNNSKPDGIDREMSLLASQLPEGSALPESAWQAVIKLNHAVLRGDRYEISKAEKLYEACIWKLNGNSFFGAGADKKQAASVIEAYCQAEKGQVPLWGQNGKFVIISRDGIRTWVKVKRGIHYYSAEFHIVDLNKPFISETGFRSHIFWLKEVEQGESVSDYLSRVFNGHLDASKKPVILRPGERDSLAADPLPEWVKAIVPAPYRLPETLPAGFVRVEVVLPAAKAFTARKWSQAAQERIQLIAQADKEAEFIQEEEARQSAASRKIYKGGLKTVDSFQEFYVGAICEIVSVNHPVQNRLIGNRVKIVTIYDCGTIAAHDAKPPVTRVNRRGNTVIVSDPSTIRSHYGAEQLRLISPETDNTDNG